MSTTHTTIGALAAEPRISFSALARRENVHVSTVWRWALRGIRGHRLECLIVGQRRYTTLPAFARWLALINGEPAAPTETPAARERSIRRAEKRAQELGV